MLHAARAAEITPIKDQGRRDRQTGIKAHISEIIFKNTYRRRME